MNIQQSFAFLSVSPPDSLAICVEPAGSPEFQAPCSSAACAENHGEPSHQMPVRLSCKHWCSFGIPKVYRELAPLQSKIC